jgi:hypothetical protein
MFILWHWRRPPTPPTHLDEVGCQSVGRRENGSSAMRIEEEGDVGCSAQTPPPPRASASPSSTWQPSCAPNLLHRAHLFYSQLCPDPCAHLLHSVVHQILNGDLASSEGKMMILLTGRRNSPVRRALHLRRRRWDLTGEEDVAAHLRQRKEGRRVTVLQ